MKSKVLNSFITLYEVLKVFIKELAYFKMLKVKVKVKKKRMNELTDASSGIEADDCKRNKSKDLTKMMHK